MGHASHSLMDSRGRTRFQSRKAINKQIITSTMHSVSMKGLGRGRNLIGVKDILHIKQEILLFKKKKKKKNYRKGIK